MDAGIYALAARLRDELAAQLDETRAGAPCYAVVHPSAMYPSYGCSCATGEGLAWVRVVSIGASVNYPQPHGVPVSRRDPEVGVVVLELGVYRCFPQPEDKDAMLPIAHIDSLARDVIDDAAAMRRAARCAFRVEEQPIVGTWQPYTGGEVHGGVLTVTVMSDSVCPCDAEPPQLDEVVAPLLGDPRFY